MSVPSLDSTALRVLGALLEKQMSTPEYYPLTLNALVNACNQSSNRDPVMHLEEDAVLDGIEALRAEQLAWEVRFTGSRTTKYEHRLRERFDLTEQEAAILCELMLRGPQTPGELRARTQRLYAFQDLPEVEAALDCLDSGPERLAVKLPRQPGSREARFAQVLGGSDDPRATQPLAAISNGEPVHQLSLRDEVAALRSEIATLRAEFEAFRSQLE
ncbi:MAG: YceH family protein [Holophaga sp.]